MGAHTPGEWFKSAGENRRIEFDERQSANQCARFLGVRTSEPASVTPVPGFVLDLANRHHRPFKPAQARSPSPRVRAARARS
jgi:hypothetical protein